LESLRASHQGLVFQIRGGSAYSVAGQRSLVVIDARRALMTTNDMVSLRPFVILAIRMLGPGRRRLKMVKLAHDLNDARGDMRSFEGGLHVAVDRQEQSIATRRAA
jgi:hypothetical protein